MCTHTERYRLERERVFFTNHTTNAQASIANRPPRVATCRYLSYQKHNYNLSDKITPFDNQMRYVFIKLNPTTTAPNAKNSIHHATAGGVARFSTDNQQETNDHTPTFQIHVAFRQNKKYMSMLRFTRNDCTTNTHGAPRLAVVYSVEHLQHPAGVVYN